MSRVILKQDLVANNIRVDASWYTAFVLVAVICLQEARPAITNHACVLVNSN